MDVLGVIECGQLSGGFGCFSLIARFPWIYTLLAQTLEPQDTDAQSIQTFEDT